MKRSLTVGAEISKYNDSLSESIDFIGSTSNILKNTECNMECGVGSNYVTYKYGSNKWRWVINNIYIYIYIYMCVCVYVSVCVCVYACVHACVHA